MKLSYYLSFLRKVYFYRVLIMDEWREIKKIGIPIGLQWYFSA
jgi:hypothetical protein